MITSVLPCTGRTGKTTKMQLQPAHKFVIRHTMAKMPYDDRQTKLEQLRTYKAPAEVIRFAENVHAELLLAERRRPLVMPDKQPDAPPFWTTERKVAAAKAVGVLSIGGASVAGGIALFTAFPWVGLVPVGLFVLSSLWPSGSARREQVVQDNAGGPINVTVNVNAGSGSQNF